MKDFKFEDYGINQNGRVNMDVGATILEEKKRELLAGMNMYSIASARYVTHPIELFEGIRSEREYMILDFLNGKNGVEKVGNEIINKANVSNLHGLLDSYCPKPGMVGVVNYAINAAFYTKHFSGQPGYIKGNIRLAKEVFHGSEVGKAIRSEEKLWSRIVNNAFWELPSGTNLSQDDFFNLSTELVTQFDSFATLSGIHYFEKVKQCCSVPSIGSLRYDADSLAAYSTAVSQRMSTIGVNSDYIAEIFAKPLFEELEQRVNSDEPERMISEQKAMLIAYPLKRYKKIIA